MINISLKILIDERRFSWFHALLLLEHRLLLEFIFLRIAFSFGIILQVNLTLKKVWYNVTTLVMVDTSAYFI